MSQLELNLVDQAGKSVRVKLPGDRPISELTASIRRVLGLPETDERGRLQLVLHHKVSGRDLPPDATLEEQSVNHGDVIRLRMEAIAGSGSRIAWGC